VTPLLAITVGDPAGIGPEVLLGAAADPRCRAARLLAVGSARALARAAAVVPVAPELHPVENPAAADFRPGVLDVLSVTGDADVPVGRCTAAAGELAFRTVIAAVDLAVRGQVDGIVTAPINKEALALAGHPYPGHTELLAELTDTTDYAMMLTAGPLRVAHVTTHIALRDVPARVTPERVRATIEVTAAALRRMGIADPVIGVAGVNPHAGEGGLFGDEEERLVAPGVAAAAAGGLRVSGPIPPDTLFGRAVAGEFDAVVAMYHDQGHVAVKVLGFDTGVNATIGLPIVRTSVDHGTAFDIAGTGRARPESLVQAIEMAVRMCAVAPSGEAAQRELSGERSGR